MDLNKRIETLKRCDLNCNIFSVYDYDGYSMQELLCQFFTKINECIEVSNKTLELAQWLVDIGLKQEVANKLQEWLDDGTLGNLINETLFKELNEKIDKLTNVNMFIHIDEIGPTDTKENTKATFLKARQVLEGHDKILKLGPKTYHLSINPYFVNIRGVVGEKGKTKIIIDELEFQQFKIANSNDLIVDGLTISTANPISRKFGAGLIITNCNDFTVRNNIFENISAQGVLVETSNNGKIYNNYVNETCADGIHCHRGCKNIWIYENTISKTGDDGIACFTYTTDRNEFNTGLNENIYIFNNKINSTGSTVMGYGAKGISCGGSENVKIYNNIITNTFNGGISVMVDRTDSYIVARCKNVTINENIIYSNKSTSKISPITVMCQVDGEEINDVKIFDNMIYKCYNGGVFITTENIQKVLVKNVDIYNNTIKDTLDTNYGLFPVFRFKRCVNVRVNNNICENMLGCVVRNESDGLTDLITFEKNTIINCNTNKNAVPTFELYGNNNVLRENVIHDSNNNYTQHVSLKSDTNTIDNNKVVGKDIIVAYGNYKTKKVCEEGKSILYRNAIPTVGTWKKGDICYNTTPFTGTPVGWVCITEGKPGTWENFGQVGMRSTDNVSNLTPNFIGETIRKWDTKDVYMALGMTSSDWKMLT